MTPFGQQVADALVPEDKLFLVLRDVAEIEFDKNWTAGVSKGGSLTAAVHAVVDTLRNAEAPRITAAIEAARLPVFRDAWQLDMDAQRHAALAALRGEPSC